MRKQNLLIFGLSMALIAIPTISNTKENLNLQPRINEAISEETHESVYMLEPASGSNNSYTGNCDIVIDEITWNLTGNSTMQPWRIGGKSLNGVDRVVYSKTQIADNVSAIRFTFGSANNITVNSMKVEVASDENFSNITEELNPTFEANDVVDVEKANKSTDWSNSYYRFTFNVTVSDTKNKFFEFSSAEFFADKDTSAGTKHTITFKNGDETFDSKVFYGDGLVTRPETDPEKEDYTFNCWELSNGTEFDFENTTITDDYAYFDTGTKDLTLYAHYTIIPFDGFEALETKASLKFSYTDENHEYTVGGNTYAKISDSATLEDGDEIIIVNETAGVALGQQNNNNFGTANYDINDTLITPSNAVSILTIGEEEGGYSIKLGSKFLYAASSSSNYLKTEDELSGNSTWSIEIVDGNANIVAQGKNSRNILRYNSQNSLFSCYASGQEDVQIYKRQTSTVNSDYNISNVGLRFRIQIPTATVYTDLSTYSPTYGVAFYLGAANEVSPSYHYETCEPKAVDSNMQYALVIDNIPYTAWEQEITAKAYVQINGKEYYAQSKTYSVKSIAEDYINNHSEDEAVNTHADVLLFLATFND